MTSLLRQTLRAGAIVAVVGLAIVGVAAASDGWASTPAETPAVAAGGGIHTPDPTSVDGAVDAILAADQTAAPERLRAGVLRRLAAWRHLVHATATLDLPALGGLTTVQLDHGTVSAVSTTSLTIAEVGGTSVTVDLGASPKVRRNGTKAAVTDLKTGDEAFVMSRVESDGTEAYLIVVPRT
jgi:hypothetical protein